MPAFASLFATVVVFAKAVNKLMLLYTLIYPKAAMSIRTGVSAGESRQFKLKVCAK